MAEVYENKDSFGIETAEQFDADSNKGKAKNRGGGDQSGNYTFSDLNEMDISQSANNIDFLLDIPLEITIELGRTKMLINELLKLGQGAVIELSKFAGETLDVLANQRLIAKGEVVVINDKYGIRLTEIISPMERVARLK